MDYIIGALAMLLLQFALVGGLALYLRWQERRRINKPMATPRPDPNHTRPPKDFPDRQEP